MNDEESSNWYTVLETNADTLELFSSTLAQAKKAIVDWLIKTCPTQLTLGDVGHAPPITCEKSRGGRVDTGPCWEQYLHRYGRRSLL